MLSLLTLLALAQPHVDVLVLDVETVDADAVALRALGLAVAQRLDARDELVASSADDVRQLLSAEGVRQAADCKNETSCLAEIGSALGARYLIAGRVTQTGSRLLWQATLLDAVEVRALQRASRDADDIAGLVDAAAGVADELIPPEPSALKTGLLSSGAVVGGVSVVAAAVFGVWTLQIDRALEAPTSAAEQQRAFDDAQWVPWALVGSGVGVVVGAGVVVAGALSE